MTHSSRRAHLVATVLLSGLLACTQALATPAATPPFSALYAFGDSLSDTGNLLGFTSYANGLGLDVPVLPQPFDATTGGYWNGRFSNGPVAVERLAANLGLSSQLHNFAFGGATSGAGPTYPTPGGGFNTGLSGQLSTYSQMSGGAADANALYFLWIGGNDLRDGLASLANPQLSLQDKANLLNTTVANVATNIGAGLTQLHKSGARHFLVPLQPDFGLTPEGADLQAGLDFFQVPVSVSGISDQINDGLLASLSQVALPGASVTFWNPIPLQRDVAAHPTNYGISSVLTPCFSGYVGEPEAVCAEGLDTTAMFWDKVHPSAITHTILGNAMAAAVPEPATMLMMALGVVALLGASRRRPRT
jgi:phospholipase/lecithinase/hemolysin